uniref:SAP domain-containing protein n=1 Tax=Kalanchoe fedtschenkoi TaxID=63787 RepID=A0A7N0RAN3_KALFE
MDAPSSTSKPSDSGSLASDASKFLANLPSRGLFSSNVISSKPGRLRVYVCDHDTTPPEAQLIRTNETNILIRYLTSKKNKSDSKRPCRENSSKRVSENELDRRSKRAVASSQSSSRHEALNSGPPIKEYHNLTVERLRSLLRVRGLSVKGKKAHAG